jgi:hypothetical protein
LASLDRRPQREFDRALQRQRTKDRASTLRRQPTPTRHRGPTPLPMSSSVNAHDQPPAPHRGAPAIQCRTDRSVPRCGTMWGGYRRAARRGRSLW